MSILRRQSVTRGVRKLDALLVVSVTLLFTAAPLAPRNAAIGVASGTAMLAVLAWYKRCRAAAPFSTFCVISLGLALSRVTYFQVVLGAGLLCYAGVVRGVPWLRGTATWARWGSFDVTVRFLSLATWLLAAAALLSWYLLLHPNIADIVKAFVPALPLGLLIAGGLIFSMVNAAVEEGAYRGVILHALDSHSAPDSRLFYCKPLPLERSILGAFRAAGSALASLVSTGCLSESFGDALAACSLLG